MVGLGETDEEILQVMRDMREHDIDMLTIGQYLAPSTSHLPVRRYVHPDTFKMFEAKAQRDGLQPRRRGRDGALQLPRRPAGARRRCCQHLSAQANLYALGAIALWATLASLGVSLRHVPPFLLTGLALVIGSVPAWPLMRQWKVPAHDAGAGHLRLVRLSLPAVHRAAPRSAGRGQSGQLPVAAADRGAGAAAAARHAAAAGPRHSGGRRLRGRRGRHPGRGREHGRRLVMGLPARAGFGLHLGQLLAADPAGASLSHRRHRPVRPGVRRAVAVVPLGAGAAGGAAAHGTGPDRRHGPGPLGRGFLPLGQGAQAGRCASHRHPELHHAAGFDAAADAGQRPAADLEHRGWPRR